MEYRMYCLAERHLSGIQKAIQSAHAIVEYGMHYTVTEEYRQWGNQDKTIIVLDGGTVQDMMYIVDSLKEIKIPFATFKEPDMGWMMTSIALLVDERVFDYKTYGKSYEDYQKLCERDCEPPKLNYDEWVDMIGGKSNELLKSLLFGLKLAI